MGATTSIVWALTVSPSLPVRLTDALLTATEAALFAQGASRVWVDGERPAIAVLAEFSLAALDAADGPLDASSQASLCLRAIL